MTTANGESPCRIQFIRVKGKGEGFGGTEGLCLSGALGSDRVGEGFDLLPERLILG